MSLEVNGKLKLLYEKQSFSSGFEKREFVITTQEQYPQDVKFECIKEKIAQLDGLNPGDDIKVSFNLRGNEYQGKYYVNLQAWRVEKDAANSGAPAQSNRPPEYPVFEEPETNATDDDDLPF